MLFYYKQKQKSIDEVKQKEINETKQLEEQGISLLLHIKELSQLKYDSEERREQNLLQQASQMQLVFSFMMTAIIAIIAICIQNRIIITLKFYIVATTNIVILLLASLVTSSLAQWRYKTKAFPDIFDIYNTIEKDYKNVLKKSQQLKQWIDIVGKIQTEKARLNDRRVKLIIASMICFYLSIGCSIFWFLIALIK